MKDQLTESYTVFISNDTKKPSNSFMTYVKSLESSGKMEYDSTDKSTMFMFKDKKEAMSFKHKSVSEFGSWAVELESVNEIKSQFVQNLLESVYEKLDENSLESMKIILIKMLVDEFDYKLKDAEKTVEKMNDKEVTSEYKKFTKKGFINEGKNDYVIYHSTYTSAIEEALSFAKKNGYSTNEDETFDIIGAGPKKPSDGKTNKLTIPLYKNDKPQRKSLHIQVYGMGNRYELNMYIS